MQCQLCWVGPIIRMYSASTPSLFCLSFRKAVDAVVVKWNVFMTTSSFCWRNDRYRPASSSHLSLIDVWRDGCKDGLATFSANYNQGRSSPASVPHFLLAADSWPTLPHLWENLCVRFWFSVIYASIITHPQVASTVSSSTSTDSYKQASKPVTLCYVCMSAFDATNWYGLLITDGGYFSQTPLLEQFMGLMSLGILRKFYHLSPI